MYIILHHGITSRLFLGYGNLSPSLYSKEDNFFKCRMCPFKSKYCKSVYRHVNAQHCRQQRMPCPICGKLLGGRKDNLKAHVRNVHKLDPAAFNLRWLTSKYFVGYFKNWMLILVLLCENELQRWDTSRYIKALQRSAALLCISWRVSSLTFIFT